jgi:hypothetical protein
VAVTESTLRSSEPTESYIGADDEITEGGTLTNWFALLCLFFGIASWLVLQGRPFLFLPFVTLFLGLCSYLHRWLAPRRVGGAKLAAVGLMIAAPLAPWLVIRENTVNQRYYDAALPLMSQWLSLFGKGEVKIACELAQKPFERILGDTPLEEYYDKTKEGSKKIGQFSKMGNGCIAALIRNGDRSQWKPVGFVGIERFDSAETVTVEFRDVSNTVSAPLFLSLGWVDIPNASADAPRQWYIVNAQFN